VDAPYDAIELNAKRPQERPRVIELARERELPLVAASDAHFPFEVGTAYTLVDVETPVAKAVVDAIQSNRIDVHVGEGYLSQIRERVYEYVHRFRGHV
jgi:hypothetical protein